MIHIIYFSVVLYSLFLVSSLVHLLFSDYFHIRVVVLCNALFSLEAHCSSMHFTIYKNCIKDISCLTNDETRLPRWKFTIYTANPYWQKTILEALNVNARIYEQSAWLIRLWASSRSNWFNDGTGKKVQQHRMMHVWWGTYGSIALFQFIMYPLNANDSILITWMLPLSVPT